MSFLQKLRDGANKATDYAQQTMKVTKMNSLISAKRNEIEGNCTEIGVVAYKAFKAGDLVSAEEQIRIFSIANLAIERDIEELIRKIDLVKNEKTCSCGRKALADAKFCSHCGKHFPYEQVVEADVQAEQESENKECRNCGVQLEPEAKYCEQCGSAQGS